MAVCLNCHAEKQDPAQQLLDGKQRDPQEQRWGKFMSTRQGRGAYLIRRRAFLEVTKVMR